MPKHVLNVGQCSMDHAAITRLITSNFEADVAEADSAKEAINALRMQSYDLVLVNRKLDRDYSDGLEIIKQIKSDPELASVPCMLVTNYEDHQQTAIAAGAVPGFGKSQYRDPQTLEKLSTFLK